MPDQPAAETMHTHGQKPPSTSRHAALSAQGARWRPPAPEDLLLSIDDTDNLESPGTGHLARELALLLAEQSLGKTQAITRHQLLVDPRIPYTSHNSSACLVVGQVADPAAVFALACQYLSANAASGSDVGVVMLRRAAVDVRLQHWGQQAKQTVLELSDARALARAVRAEHAELSGTGGGLIGALAAIGLHSLGDDGRLLWLRGLRERAGQTLSAQALQAHCAVVLETLDGERPTQADDLVELGTWPRAIYRQHQPVLLVEPNDESARTLWRCVARDVVKRF